MDALDAAIDQSLIDAELAVEDAHYGPEETEEAREALADCLSLIGEWMKRKGFNV